MTDTVMGSMDSHMLALGWDTLVTAKNLLLMILGFSAVIFVHELGHFLAAKWCDVRVDKFAVGFGKAICSWRKGIGFRWGSTQTEFRQRLVNRVEESRRNELQFHEKLEPTDTELARAAKELKLGETEYCFNTLPLGGYVKMLGQEDFAVDKSGELVVKDDPRAFTHKPIPQRMLIVSAGVFMNLVFAAVVFMLVFMMGKPSLSAKVGLVVPGSPADKAGLRPGDSIVKIDGRDIVDRDDLVMAVMLSDPNRPMALVYDRKDAATGQIKSHEVQAKADYLPGEESLKLGVSPPITLKVGIAAVDPTLPSEQQFQRGDVITAVNGQEITDFYAFETKLVNSMGEWQDVTVRRPPADGKGEATIVQVRHRGRLPLGQPGNEDGAILGFVPRVVFNEILGPGEKPATELRRGDVIVRWGGILAPRMSEILKSIQQDKGKDIAVTVLRGNEEKVVTVHPVPRSRIRSTVEPLTARNPWVMESDHVVLADIDPTGVEDAKSPAALLKESMPRGSVLTKVNDQPVSTWPEVLRKFIELAGTDVSVTWVYEGTPEQSAKIHVPATLHTSLHLPIAAIITSINGKGYVEVDNKGKRDLLPVDNTVGQRTLLKELMGKTVKVEYQRLEDPDVKTAEIKIEPDMLNPWTKPLVFDMQDMMCDPEKIVVQERNPLKAIKIGIWKTYYFIEQCYITGERMIFTRSVSMDNVSGPVGIFRLGVASAEVGMPFLLYFLAMISANLAVINFLPLPIVDGGLFVFLLIEWIKGRPVSLKVQVATQMIGLALIISVFVYVTFLDVSKF